MTNSKYASLHEDLQAFLQGLADEDKFSGTVLVAKDDDILFTGAYGYADRGRKIAMQVDTKLNLGSINKSFTAVAICQLAQKGLLSLQDILEKHLPDYADISQGRITIEQLLMHTAGLGNFMAAPGYRENLNRVDLIKDYLPYCREMVGIPGERHIYSNAGYIVLGAIVEAVSGEDYFSYIDKHIYQPAGMINSGCFYREAPPPNLAIGYIRPGTPGFGASPSGPPGNQGATSEEPLPNTNWLPLRGCSAGGGYSTVEDMFRFVRGIHNEVLLSGGFATLFPHQGIDYNYAVSRQYPGAKQAVGHSGGAPGINSVYEFYQELGYTLVVQVNIDSMQPIISMLRQKIIPTTVEPVAPSLEIKGQVIPGVVPLVRQGMSFIPLEVVCKVQNLSCRRVGDRVEVTLANGNLLMLGESSIAKLGEQEILLSHPCFTHDQELMVPLGPQGVAVHLGLMNGPGGLPYGVVKLVEPPRQVQQRQPREG